MQAIILAGGMGTRLRPLTYTVPKPMLPIAGKPALARIAQELADCGFSEVFITTNYLAEVIEDGLREYSQKGNLPIPVHCIREETPLGTAGCVRNALDRLEDEFLVIQGDAVADVDFERLLRFHHERDADITITTIRVRDPRDFGILETEDDGRILRFQEKPRLEEAFSDQANAGFYMMKKSVFNGVPLGEPYDFSKQLFPRLMEQGKRFYAFEIGSYWVDIGRPQSYIEGNRHAIAGRAEVAADVVVPESVTLLPPFVIGAGTKLGEGCIIGPGAIIGARCVIGDRARMAGGVLFDGVTVGARARLDECIVATRSRIGEGAIIGALAVIGEGCDIGPLAEVAPHSRVGPIVPVAAGTVVEGVLMPSEQRIDGMQRFTFDTPATENLPRDQRLVFALLVEFGEMTAYELVRATSLGLDPVCDALDALEARGLVLSTLDVPKRYALTREISQPSRRILFADDLSDTREIFRLAFSLQGHDVRLAENGQQAIDAVREEKFDAIVLDLQMPGTSGLEALQQIRMLPNGADVPTVIFTAQDEHSAEVLACAAGADEVLFKPILPQELMARLAALMKP
jgi:NDP-sugar pyrophosphorylase family protein/CheY-like chemotaxis protein